MPGPAVLQLVDSYTAGKSRVLQLLAELEASGRYQRSVYLTPDSLAHVGPRRSTTPADPWEELIAGVIDQAKEPESGLAIYLGDGQALAIVPPFPIAEEKRVDGVDTSPLVAQLGSELLIGVVLLRLGRYAVGVLRGNSLVASKTATRYVKRPHRAGGTSQRRFERSRERLVLELFDKTCQVVRDVFAPYDSAMAHVLLGGERHTLRRLVQRCRYLSDVQDKTLGRLLQVARPGQAALDRVAYEVWSSRVLVFTRAGE